MDNFFEVSYSYAIKPFSIYSVTKITECKVRVAAGQGKLESSNAGELTLLHSGDPGSGQ